MGMMIGNTLSIIFSTSLLVLFGRKELFRGLSHQSLQLTETQHTELAAVIARVEHSAKQLEAFPSEQVPSLLSSIDQAFVYGFSVDMLLGTLAAGLIAIIVFWGMRGSQAQQNTQDKKVQQFHSMG